MSPAEEERIWRLVIERLAAVKASEGASNVVPSRPRAVAARQGRPHEPLTWVRMRRDRAD